MTVHGSTTRRTGPLTTPAAPRSWWQLAWLHARFQMIETLRTPVAVLGMLMFPALALLFFVVPQQAIASNPVAATGAATQLATFAIASVCLFTFGAGVAEDRAKPFDPYLRTLPAAAGPRVAGRVLNGVVWCYLALLPVVLVAVLLTEASITAGQALAALAAVPLVAMPFLLLGIAIGWSMSSKAAVAVVQVVLFPMAFAGGLFMPPEIFPAWMESLSTALPTRAGRDVLVGLATGDPVPGRAWVVLAIWAAACAALAVAAYRRDEGRRFH